MRKLVLLGLLCSGIAGAQSLSVGVLGGAPFTNVVNTVTTNTYSSLPTSTNFVVGPALQVNLPLSLRFEVDALYRPYSFQIGGTTAVGATSVSANQWQFPFLLQYRFKTPLVKPFVEAGVEFDHLANVSAAATAAANAPGQLIHASNASVVLGGGVDVKIPFVRLSGELRYIHQGSVNFSQISNVNQAEVLFGIHF